MFFLPFLTKTTVSSDPYIHARARVGRPHTHPCSVSPSSSSSSSLSLSLSLSLLSVEEYASHLAARLRQADFFRANERESEKRARFSLSLSLSLPCTILAAYCGTLRLVWLGTRSRRASARIRAANNGRRIVADSGETMRFLAAVSRFLRNDSVTLRLRNRSRANVNPL